MKKNEFCIICGAPAECEHHWLFGRGIRPLAEADKIKSPMCNNCHTMSTSAIHGNPMAEHLSKMVGQLMWERWYLTDYGDADTLDKLARDNFIERYGRNWL